MAYAIATSPDVIAFQTFLPVLDNFNRIVLRGLVAGVSAIAVASALGTIVTVATGFVTASMGPRPSLYVLRPVVPEEAVALSGRREPSISSADTFSARWTAASSIHAPNLSFAALSASRSSVAARTTSRHTALRKAAAERPPLPRARPALAERVEVKPAVASAPPPQQVAEATPAARTEPKPASTAPLVRIQPKSAMESAPRPQIEAKPVIAATPIPRAAADPLPARTAVYDIAAHVVYMPNGDKLEAHSGLGDWMDDPGSLRQKNRGVTPPNTYELKLRESMFHGVQAIRLNPVDDDKMFGRDGILAHSYMLGSNGQSNGCVSFKDYPQFLRAFLRGEVDRMVVVTSLGNAPVRVAQPAARRTERYALNSRRSYALPTQYAVAHTIPGPL